MDYIFSASLFSSRLCKPKDATDMIGPNFKVCGQTPILSPYRGIKKYLSSSVARKRQNMVKSYGYPSCSGHYDTIDELRNHLDEKHTPKTKPEADTSFESLKNKNKWTLSTGTVVENQLYEFGKLQVGDHPSQSFIFDVNDSELYIRHGTLTSGEIEEIMINYNNIPLRMPDDLNNI
ncbi:hypothetical protein CU098_007348 [Rhizopus stolonifer]|uniref:C2H2-type domain-containing protein n=1 Tax=Rhizopus stolonifer TaxID=4846 RepID=A0A367IYX5_RHIST|nr:hypothetical protein CU098_007348 [Rhizopus stolonifer]